MRGIKALSIVTIVAILAVSSAGAQSATPPCPLDSVVPIQPPLTPIPAEQATAGTTRFSFIDYGDTRGRHDGVEIQAEHELVMESMLGTIRTLATGPDAVRFVLQSGDAVANGAGATLWNVSYSPIINRLTGANMPYFLAAGNHDVAFTTSLTDSNRHHALCHYFAANARLIPPENSPRRLNGYPTYAFGYGNSFFIAFDSNIADDSTQAAWVEGQLAGLDRKRYVNVVVFCHHPAFSSGPHGAAIIEAQTAAIRTRYMPMLRKYHVRLLLTGHEHLFEHWVERYRDSSGAHRLDEIVSGGGGAPLYAYQGEPDLRAYLQAGAAQQVRVQHLVKPGPWAGDNPYHYVVVHVDGDKISVDVVGVDWGRGFAPYTSASASLVDRPPLSPQ